MFNLELKARGHSVAGLPAFDGPDFDIAHLFTGIPASGNFKFVRFRLTDETCTLAYGSGNLVITPSVSTLPRHAVTPSFTTLYGLIVSRQGDAGDEGSLEDLWFSGADAAAIALPNEGALYSVWLRSGMDFPVRTVAIDTGTDGVVDVLVIGK